MTTYPNLQKCQTYIDCHLRATEIHGAQHSRPPSVAVSRQTGTGALAIAERLAHILETSPLKTDCPWTVFDKNLVSKVLEDHDLPARLAQFMPEDKVSYLSDALEELLGLHPPTWNLIHQTTETILKLAELGNVILVGRGANVITAKLMHVFHVRLVGSLQRRAQRVETRLGLDPAAAAAFIQREDAGRERYLKKHFGHNINDPSLYHLVLNTDGFAEKDAAEIIAHSVIARFTSSPMNRERPNILPG